MKKTLFGISLTSILIIVTISSIAIAASLIVNPISYFLSLVAGSREVQQLTLTNDKIIPLPTNLSSIITYEGENCNYEEGKDLIVSYCELGFVRCRNPLFTLVPPKSSKTIQIRHQTNIASCPGNYSVDTNVTYNDTLVVSGRGTFLFKQRFSRPIIGSASLEMTDNKVVIKLGSQTRTFTINSFSVTSEFSFTYYTSSPEWDNFTLRFVRGNIFGTGRYTYFTGKIP